MSLAPGTRLGPYEITGQIGAGGMGEVYRAHDTKLHRDVAIKVLPEALAHDTERLARFEREARTLASLNHPNIAQIHGLEESDGTKALVMELVEGPTLADRIAQGPMPADEALSIARQIAEALESAHEHGIIHRDLKPANIKLRDDGTVKVLDFGLAKALAPEPGTAGAVNLTQSPTITSPPAMTGIGVLLGTAAYMSPEQAKGRVADKRSDIWAFGCVLYETLTGKPAFPGEDITDIIASVVKGEPSWDLLPKTTPANIVFLLRRCLEKDRKRRLHDIADFRILLEAPQGAPVAAVFPRQRSRRVLQAVATVAIAVTVIVLAIWTLRSESPPSVRRFAVTLSTGDQFSARTHHTVAISPNGTHLVYVANQQLYVRRMDSLEAEPIRGTQGGVSEPFFSPDGQWIGFWQDDQLKKVAVTGGAPVVLSKAQNPTGASWGEDDLIVFGQGPEGIWQVSGSGGQPSVLIKLDPATRELAHGPQVLPGGEAILFTVRSETGFNWNDAQIVVQKLGTGERSVVIEGGSDARYVPTGHLLYVRDGVLLAVPFDLKHMATVGAPVPVVEGVDSATALGAVGLGGSGAANFSISLDGSLAYVPVSGTALRRLVWVDRQGREEPVTGAPARAYVYPRLSPDSTRVALDIRDQNQDIWVWDFSRTTLTRVTTAAPPDIAPVWMPDGKQIIFSSGPAGQDNLFRQAADGPGVTEQLSKNAKVRLLANAVLPDGSRLFVTVQELSGVYDLGILDLAGDRRTELVTQTPNFNEQNADLSPDARFVAYQSNESGQSEIFLRPFPDTKGLRHLVSIAGGTRPLWARSGRELFYLTAGGALMAVPVQTTPTLTVGTPVKLFEGPYFRGLNLRTYDVSPDGLRFLMIKEVGSGEDTSERPRIIIVQNWFEELKRLVPTN